MLLKEKRKKKEEKKLIRSYPIPRGYSKAKAIVERYWILKHILMD
jgi:hypothetical protein